LQLPRDRAATRRTRSGPQARRRRSPGPAILVGLGAVAVAVAAVVAATSQRSATSPDQRQELRTYQQAIHSLASEVGRVLVEELRPSLADLVDRKMTPTAFQSQAVEWKQVVATARQQARSLAVPPGLKGSADLFDRSMGQYEDAIDAFESASEQPSDKIENAIDAAAPLAQKADTTYDQSAALLNQALETAGLPTPTALP
jgi:F0F1-type ATP synthase membrane subunit b/b'